MSRRTALIVSGVAVLVIGGILLAVDPKAQDSSNPSIIDFEVAGTQAKVDQIRADWGESGASAAKRSLWIDYAYIVSYGTFLTLAAAATRDLALGRGWRRMAAFGVAAVPFAAAAAAFDAIEDVGLLLAVNGHGGDLAPGLSRICASLKFLLLALVIAYLVTGLVMRFRSRTA